MRTAAVLGVAAGVLSGCASFMSGLDSESTFACKAPAGVACQSIAGTYHNSVQNNLPSQNKKGNGDSAEKKPDPDANGKPVYGGKEEDRPNLSPRDMDAMSSGIPIRQPPLIVRIWVAPWEDEAGDLHDQSYFYTMVHSGKWVIEANRAAIGNRFKPVFPLSKTLEAQSKADAAPAKKSDYENLVEKPGQNSYRGPQE